MFCTELGNEKGWFLPLNALEPWSNYILPAAEYMTTTMQQSSLHNKLPLQNGPPNPMSRYN